LDKQGIAVFSSVNTALDGFFVVGDVDDASLGGLGNEEN